MRNNNEEWASVHQMINKGPQIKVDGWSRQSSVILSNFHCWPSEKEIGKTLNLKNGINDYHIERDSEPENETGENQGAFVSDPSDPTCLYQHHENNSKQNTMILKCNTFNEKINKKFKRQDNIVRRASISSRHETNDYHNSLANSVGTKIGKFKTKSKWNTIKSLFACVRKLWTIEAKPLNSPEAIKTHIQDWQPTKCKDHISNNSIEKGPINIKQEVSLIQLKFKESKIVKEALDIIIL